MSGDGPRAASGVPPGAPPGAQLDSPLGRVLAEAAHDPALASWAPVLQPWLRTDAARGLITRIEARQSAGAVIYPADVLRALRLTPLPSVRVVILGQDPYHGPQQAQGLAFAVTPGMRLPPSLRNIVQEVRRDTGGIRPEAALGDLGVWARQGVLLLNTSLTVEAASPGSHARMGWAPLTDAVLRAVVAQAAQHGRALAAMLWGAHAQALEPLFAGPQAPSRAPSLSVLVLKSNHPSPLSARRPPVPFLGCGHFSRARDFLAAAEPHAPRLEW